METGLSAAWATGARAAVARKAEPMAMETIVLVDFVIFSEQVEMINRCQS